MQNAWRTVWTASSLGPYPEGAVSVQTTLDTVLPDPSIGAENQTFRLTLRPDVWGDAVRVRFTNRWGIRALHLSSVFLGLHQASATVLDGTNTQVLFNNGETSITLPPGTSVWSDPVSPSFLADLPRKYLSGRKIALSFHVPEQSGPMTWHSSALNTSYITFPGAGDCARQEKEDPFVFSVNSWFFIDAVDMLLPEDTGVIVCFGDSITDGSNSTMNGEDRWPDILSRRIHASYGDSWTVVNAGIGGNEITGPESYSPVEPYFGGPSALQRAEYDVASLSGVRIILWLEGINDFCHPERLAGTVIDGMKTIVARWREKLPGIRIFACTLPSALGSVHPNPEYGTVRQDEKRKQLNEFIRQTSLFDGIIDFSETILDHETGKMLSWCTPNSTRGGDGDGLHPNRAGKMRMVGAIDVLSLLKR